MKESFQPDGAAAVDGACIVLHNLAIMWKVLLVEEGNAADDGDIRFGNEDHLLTEAATVQASLLHSALELQIIRLT